MILKTYEYPKRHKKLNIVEYSLVDASQLEVELVALVIAQVSTRCHVAPLNHIRAICFRFCLSETEKTVI